MKELTDIPDIFSLSLKDSKPFYSWKQSLRKTKAATRSNGTRTNGNSANESEVTGFHGEVSSVSKDGRAQLR